ncbi:MAG: class II aldolase/adducin family protein [Rhodospirillaceae bacterium]|nr:class II aldolase/adducin family protein [Rhodospirillaceae bacterium]
MRFARKRQALIAAALRMNSLGLNQGKSGNLSLRVCDGLLITPSGMDYDRLVPADIVFMTADGQVPPGQRKPSSEWRFHVDILNARPEAGAIVHAHALHCTAIACLRRPIPAFHYMVAVAGGDTIRCADYATFGTQDLSAAALAALEGRTACLLANHGMIALGATLDAALALAVEVETLAAMYGQALQIGDPVILLAEEMRIILDKFRTYGRQEV